MRDGLRRAVTVVRLTGWGLFAVGAGAERDLLAAIGLGVVVVVELLLRVDPERPAVRSLSFGDRAITAQVDGDDDVTWDRRSIAGVGVHGPVRFGTLTGGQSFVGASRSASVALLDADGRVLDAPAVSWLRVSDVRDAAGASGLTWVGRLADVPVPAVPVAAPDWSALDVPAGRVADDRRALDALLEGRRARTQARLQVALVVALAVALVVVAAVVDVARDIAIPLAVIGAGGLVVVAIDERLGRWRLSSTLASVRAADPGLRWSAAECVVVDVAPGEGRDRAVLVLGPDAATVVSTLRLEDRPDWLQARRRLWLLVAADPSVARGVVALPDRSRAASVRLGTYHLALAQAWLDRSAAGVEARPASAVPTRGVEGRAVGHDGSDGDEGGR